MRTFKVGDVVRIVRVPPDAIDRRGTICRVVHVYTHDNARRFIARRNWQHIVPTGTTMYRTDLPSSPGTAGVSYPGEYLAPHREGDEYSDKTLTEILDGVRGVKAKERTE